MTKKLLVNVLKLALGIALFSWVIWRHWGPSPSGAPGLGEAFSRPVQWLPIVLAGIFYLIGLLSTFYRWYLLVRAQDLPFTLGNAARLGLVGFSMNTFIPGSIGGDAVKALFIAREQSRRTVAVATVLLDRALGLWGLIWLVTCAGLVFLALGSPVLLENQSVLWYVYTMAGITALSLIVWFLLGTLPQARADILAERLSRVPKVGHSLAEFWRAFWLYRCKGRSIAAALLLSVFNHTAMVFAFYFAAQAFQPDGSTAAIPTLGQHFLIVPLAMAIQTVPLTPGGVGVGELVFGKLYELLGYTDANGVLGALALRLVVLWWAFVGYLVYLRMKPALAGELKMAPVSSQAGGYSRCESDLVGDNGQNPELIGRGSP